jgi:hypothetical protein
MLQIGAFCSESQQKCSDLEHFEPSSTLVAPKWQNGSPLRESRWMERLAAGQGHFCARFIHLWAAVSGCWLSEVLQKAATT